MSAYISTRDLHFQSIGRSFFQEISCLPDKRIPLMPIWRRLRLNNPEQGFYLVSASTGMEILMVLTETKRIDGDVVSWTFHPVNKNVPINNVVIVND